MSEKGNMNVNKTADLQEAAQTVSNEIGNTVSAETTKTALPGPHKRRRLPPPL